MRGGFLHDDLCEILVKLFENCFWFRNETSSEQKVYSQFCWAQFCEYQPDIHPRLENKAHLTRGSGGLELWHLSHIV